VPDVRAMRARDYSLTRHHVRSDSGWFVGYTEAIHKRFWEMMTKVPDRLSATPKWSYARLPRLVQVGL